MSIQSIFISLFYIRFWILLISLIHLLPQIEGWRCIIISLFIEYSKGGITYSQIDVRISTSYIHGPDNSIIIDTVTPLKPVITKFIISYDCWSFRCLVHTNLENTSTWNTSHLTRRLLFLSVTLALTAGPTFYVAFTDTPGGSSNVPLIIGIVQFFISVVATLLFAIMPSGRIFGDRVAEKSRKYLASQTFTASYPSLSKSARCVSILRWVLIFLCKFVESYFFLTQSFRDPIRVMVGMKIQGCNDRFFGNNLCTNQAAFTLTIMYIMDLVLFFLDTFLWYVIWSTVLSIARSFILGLSIWTPWCEIYLRLPKRIYAKLLATVDMEVRYKPKVLVSQI